MNRIYKAKQIYNSIEIPNELNSIVAAAIENGGQIRKNKFSYIKAFAPVAVCAVLCLVLGINGFFSHDTLNTDIPENESSGISLARMAPQQEESPMSAQIADTPYSTMVAIRVENERKKGNELNLLFLDKSFASFSCVTDEGEVVYYNFKQSDGSDVFLKDLGYEEYPDNTAFYIKSENTAVVIIDGKQEEIDIIR